MRSRRRSTIGCWSDNISFISVVFHQHTRNKMLAVSARVSAHADELRTDLSNQNLLLIGFCYGQCPLKDVVYMSGQ